MDIFFQDPNEIPLPPEEVRILDFSATPYPDGRRVRVYVELTPFQKRPNITVYAENQESLRVAEVSIIESMTRKMEFTMHLRGAGLTGDFLTRAIVFYVPVEEDQDAVEPESQGQGEKTIVDQADTRFSISVINSN